jgi:hypothetical protein
MDYQLQNVSLPLWAENNCYSVNRQSSCCRLVDTNCVSLNNGLFYLSFALWEGVGCFTDHLGDNGEINGLCGEIIGWKEE